MAEKVARADLEKNVQPILDALAPGVHVTITDTAFGTSVLLSSMQQDLQILQLASAAEPEQLVADEVMKSLADLQRAAVQAFGLEVYIQERIRAELQLVHDNIAALSDGENILEYLESRITEQG